MSLPQRQVAPVAAHSASHSHNGLQALPVVQKSPRTAIGADVTGPEAMSKPYTSQSIANQPGMSNLDEARPLPLIQGTVRRLLQDILTGVYGPGDRIREAEVAQRLGISRAPVREALRMLEQDGLVVVLPWRGASVVDPTPQEIAALFDLLGTVYGAVARFAARHASDDALKQFSRDVALFAKATAEGRDSFHLIDIAYRAGTDLGLCCGSTLAADVLRKLGRVAYLQHRFLLPVPPRWRQQSVARFRKLEAALLSRSEDRSEAAGRKLVQHTQTLLVLHATASLPAAADPKKSKEKKV